LGSTISNLTPSYLVPRLLTKFRFSDVSLRTASRRLDPWTSSRRSTLWFIFCHIERGSRAADHYINYRPLISTKF